MDILILTRVVFRKNNSTVNKTVHFTNDIFNAINQRLVTVATFVDMAKAFDTVNHAILLNKLIKVGFSGNLLKLLQNYLSNRKQTTMANGITSDTRKISCGIPQESTVRPLLFIIYVNDISSILKHCKYQLYADDTVIYLSDEINSATNNITTDLARFKIWCNQKKLTMNIKKTKYVVFVIKSQVRKVVNHSLKIGDIPIERGNSYKYHGITLDSALTFNRHLENCIRFSSYKVFLLSKIRKYITFEAANRNYKTMILPIIEYGDILYVKDVKCICYCICINKKQMYVA